MARRYATIDIGTNTILMLIAERNKLNGFKVIRDEHSLARLGQGIGLNQKMILPSAIDRAGKILKRYKDICDEMKVSEIYAVATSAMRDAENSVDVKKKFNTILGTNIEIISGEVEANFSFNGAVEDGKDSVVIDIGGGSTEIIFGNKNKIQNRYSLQIGAVRLTESHFSKQPPNDDDIQKAGEIISVELSKVKIENFEKVYAVAGTPTTLAGIMLNLKAFDRDFIQGYKLTLSNINWLFESMKRLTTQEIIKQFNVNPERADIITAGTLILLKILEHLDHGHCLAGTKGLRYGMMKYLVSK